MKIISENRKARYDYFIEQSFQAGIVLKGSEVKSVRLGQVSLSDAYVSVIRGELYIKNMYIKPYEKSSAFTPHERQDRKLLLNKAEINKIIGKAKEKGYTIVPTKVYFSGSLVKIEIALAKGKHTYDKKQSLAERDLDRDMLRQVKNCSRLS